MTTRTFLEDVATPYSINATGNAKAWEIRHLRNDRSIPPLMYVVESEAGQQFLLGREISGRPKFNLIRYMAKSFVELFFEHLSGKELFQYLILRGAYPFDLQYAFAYAAPYDRLLLPTGFIKLERILNPEGADWEIRAENLIGEYRGDTWLVADTAVASGSTIAYFLRNSFVRHIPKQVYVIMACGSLGGIRRIYQECQKKNVELVPVFFECLFEVSKVGNLPKLPLTDLSMISADSITTKSLYEKAVRRYQGTRMCCIGDVGESLEDPITYSIHTLWEMQLLGMDPKKEDWNAWTLDMRTEEVKKKVTDFNPSLADYFRDLWTSPNHNKG